MHTQKFTKPKLGIVCSWGATAFKCVQCIWKRTAQWSSSAESEEYPSACSRSRLQLLWQAAAVQYFSKLSGKSLSPTVKVWWFCATIWSEVLSLNLLVMSIFTSKGAALPDSSCSKQVKQRLLCRTWPVSSHWESWLKSQLGFAGTAHGCWNPVCAAGSWCLSKTA